MCPRQGPATYASCSRPGVVVFRLPWGTRPRGFAGAGSATAVLPRGSTLKVPATVGASQRPAQRSSVKLRDLPRLPVRYTQTGRPRPGQAAREFQKSLAQARTAVDCPLQANFQLERAPDAGFATAGRPRLNAATDAAPAGAHQPQSPAPPTAGFAPALRRPSRRGARFQSEAANKNVTPA